jgi:DNA invertase Pin-like site-specific DNA recombinase
MTLLTEAVFYARASTKKQEDSVPLQRDWSEQAAKRHGLTVLREFSDEGIAGDEIALRPGLQRLLAFVEERCTVGLTVPVLLVYDSDRLSRASSIRTGAILTRLLDAGCTRVVTNEGTVDLQEDTDLLLYNLKQDTAKAAYSKLLSGRVANAMLRKAKSGQWCGGPVPFGYRAGPDGRLVVVPREAEVVKWMFRRYADCVTSLSELLRQLEHDNAPVPAGARSGRWSRPLVWSVLRNPHVLGNVYYGRTTLGKYSKVSASGVSKIRGARSKSGKLRQVDNSPSEWLVTEGAHEPIIDHQLFDAVQEKLRAARLDREVGSRPRVKTDWPLAGLCQCGDCGCNMTGMTLPVGRKRVAFVRKMGCQTYKDRGRGACSFNAVPESDILETVFDIIREQFSDPDSLERIRHELSADRGNAGTHREGEMKELRQRIGQLTTQVKGATNRIASIDLPADILADVVANITELKVDRTRAETRLRELEDATASTSRQDNEIEAALAAFGRLGELVRQEHHLPEVRDALHALVEKIEMHFSQQETPGRRRSTCTAVTVHWRSIGEILPPSLRSLAEASRS